MDSSCGTGTVSKARAEVYDSITLRVRDLRSRNDSFLNQRQ